MHSPRGTYSRFVQTNIWFPLFVEKVLIPIMKSLNV